MTDPALEIMRIPRAQCEVQWNGVDWVDESEYLIAASGEARIATPGERLVATGDIATATITLWNGNGRFSWRRTDSALYAYIGGAAGLFGKRVRLSIGFEVGGSVATYYRVFTGVIFDWSEDSAARTITLNLRDDGFLYIQKRASTTVYENWRVDELIDMLATMAGITNKEIDPSPYTIRYAWLDDESILAEAWEIAQADGGRCYFDREGTFRFEQAAHWVFHSTPNWVLDEDDYVLAEPEIESEELTTRIKVEIQPRAAGASSEVYRLDRARIIPPGETIEFDCKLNQATSSVDDPVANEDYEIVSAGGEDLSGDCTLTLVKYAQRVRVSITNNHATHQAYLTQLTLYGTPLVGGPTEEVVEEVASPPISFTRERAIGGNPYIQDATTAKALAQMLRDRGAALNPRYILRQAPGIPQLNLGDRVRFQDAHAITGTRDGFVAGIRWRFENGFMQDITLLDAAELFSYSDYFIVGTTALGTHGRCWY